MMLKKSLHFIDNSWNRGQALVIAVMMIPLLIVLFAQTLRFSRFIERKIALQNGVDAALLCAVTELATGLNRLSQLNQKLIYYHRLLILLKSGGVISPTAGLVITKEMVEKKIRRIALKQDLIKKNYPILATKKAFYMAQKHHTPHIALKPTMLSYAIRRIPTQDPTLPGPYELIPNFRQSHRWSISGTLYRKAYHASATVMLSGNDVTTPTWKGIFIE